MRLVGFTGDGSAYCVKHGEERYGPAVHAFIYPALDKEGNIVGGVFDIDEGASDLVCDVPHGYRPDGTPIFNTLI